MPTLNAVDSYGKPNADALAAQGIRLASRYLSHDPPKNLTAVEAGKLHAAGVAVLLNWESDPGRPLLGAAAGAQDGSAAASLAESIGAPHGLTIYYSCDRDINSTQYPQIDAYYQAAAAVTAGRYLVGVYGELALVDHLYGHSSVTSFWQTYAWSGDDLSPVADLYQYRINMSLPGVGTGVDYDEIINAAQLGAWWPEGLSPSGGGTPIPAPEPDEDDMLQPQGVYVRDTRNSTSWLMDFQLRTKVHIVDQPTDDAMTQVFANPNTVDGPWYKTAALVDSGVGITFAQFDAAADVTGKA